MEKSNASYLHILIDKGWLNLAVSQDLSYLSMGPDVNGRYIIDSENDVDTILDINMGMALARIADGSADTSRTSCGFYWTTSRLSSAVWYFSDCVAVTSKSLIEFTVALGCVLGRIVVLRLADGSPYG